MNKAKLVEHIAELVRDKKLEGISDLRDESDRDGMRIVDRAEARRDPARGAEPALQAHRDAVDVRRDHAGAGARRDTRQLVPKVMPLKEVLEHFIEHRHEVIVRRTQFDLDKALEREHILEGLKIAVDNIDEVIKIIRGRGRHADGERAARRRGSSCRERQAEAILNMRLAKLTGLEIEKLEAELQGSARARSRSCARILASQATARMKILKERAARQSPRSSATSAAPRSRATRASSRSRT